jgi:hypothetical protein
MRFLRLDVEFCHKIEAGVKVIESLSAVKRDQPLCFLKAHQFVVVFYPFAPIDYPYVP